MTTQGNKALVRRYGEAHNTNNLALLNEIVEHWGENDALGTMQQPGLVPMPGK